jgi:hypothetical protein
MNFTQKRTCKGCQVSDEGICTVEKAPVNDGSRYWMFHANVPSEPCFKPKTGKEWAEFIRTYQYMQVENLKILRLKEAV